MARICHILASNCKVGLLDESPTTGSCRCSLPVLLVIHRDARRVWSGLGAGRISEDLKTKLAYAIVRGESVTVWGRKNGVARTTAFRWAKLPEVREIVNAWRRQSIDRAVGRLARRRFAQAEGIFTLGTESDSDSVRLRAWRAFLADQMQVAQFADLEHRMAELEQEIKAEKQSPG